MATAGQFVLVVEDDSDLNGLIAELLQRAGYRVRQVTGGEEALTVARQERPSLVLLDIRLPGISGYEVCRELRATFGERLPIVFISGERTEPYDRVAGLRLGADDHIVKPFAPDELLARIERLLKHTAYPIPEEAGSRAVSRLSARELEVLQLLANGRTPKEIALDLSVSRKTVSNHIQNILVKLDVHSQAQAVVVAFSEGVVAVPEMGPVPAAHPRPASRP